MDIHEEIIIPLKIERSELEEEIAKKKKNPGNMPFIDTFRGWVRYRKECGDNISAFGKELPELEKMETLAILEKKLKQAESNLAEAHFHLLPKAEKMFIKAKRLGCDVKDIEKRRLPKLRKDVTAIARLENMFSEAEKYPGLSGSIQLMEEAIENARHCGYNVSDYEERRLPEIKKKQAMYLVELNYQCLANFSSTMYPITDYADWRKEVDELEQLIEKAKDLKNDVSKFSPPLISELRKKISMNEVEKAFRKQKSGLKEDSCLPQNIAILINQAKEEGNDVTQARQELEKIMKQK